MNKKKEQEKEFKCLRCNWDWIALVETPRCCPKCKSYYWQMPRIRK